MTAQVRQLCFNLDQLAGRVGELQEELMVRHGLMLLLEVLVIGLVFLLCRSGGGRTGEGEKAKQEKRTNSIEVGCLPNG